jgi:hypothetical protein
MDIVDINQPSLPQLDADKVYDSFQFGIAPHIFRDAIVMRRVDYEALTPEQIQAMKQDRYDKWVALTNLSVKAPDYVVKSTLE